MMLLIQEETNILYMCVKQEVGHRPISVKLVCQDVESILPISGSAKIYELEVSI